MKRILHMTPPDIKNGVYRYIFNHMQFMNMQKYSFSFWTKGAKELRETSEYKKYGFGIYELKGTQREDKDAFQKEIIEVLGQGFDILHLHTSSWRGFLIEEVAMELGIPKVIVHSHSTGIDVKDKEERVQRIHIHEIYQKQFSLKYATDVWACSHLAATWLFGTSVPLDKIQIMPNAIDTSRYCFDLKKRQQIRDKLKLHGKYVIGNIGRYTYQKNQAFLIRVIAELRKKRENVYFLCLGDGELLQELRELTETYGLKNHVSLMEWQEHTEDFLQAMDVFCLPSRFEGFPISAIEAQTAGLKCLISDTVTEEVKITDLVQFLPLEEQRWVNELLVGKNLEQREKWSEVVAKKGYDIKIAAKRLEKMYDK